MTDTATLSLRPMADLRKAECEECLVLDRDGCWSTVRVDRSLSLMPSPQLYGRIAGDYAFGALSESFCEVDFADCVGWIDVADLPTFEAQAPTTSETGDA